MTLKAEQVDLAHAQEARVARTVRRVTTGAPLGLDRHVLVDKRPLLVGVTLVAGRLPPCVARP